MIRAFAAQAVVATLLVVSAPAFAQMWCTVNYVCRDSQCAAAIGGYNVTKGPFSFASESACLSQARQGMNRATCNCRAAGATAPGATSSANQSPEQAAADAMNRVISAGNFATGNNAAMTMGAGVATGLAVYAMRSAMQGPSAQELARREAVRQEQLRLQAEAEERARVEAEQRHRRIVAGLQGATLSIETPRLAGAADVRVDSPTATAGNLALLKRDDSPPPAFAQSGPRWSAEAASPPSSPGSNLALLKRGDDSLEAASMEARKPFDTAGALALPAPPPVPAAVPVAPTEIAMAPQAAALGGPAGIRQGAADAPTASQSTGSASAAVDSFMPNRAERPHVTYGAAVHKPGPAYRPGAGPAHDREVPAPQTAVVPAPPAPTPAPVQTANDPFATGAADANACRANNPGPVCAGLAEPAWSQCRANYAQGFATGGTNRDTALDGAYQQGSQARLAGAANASFTAAPQGGCRNSWVETYNRGYAGSPR